MQLTRFSYNPFRELQKIERDIDKLWESGINMVPTVVDTSVMDLYEENGYLVAEVFLPHFNRDDIKVRTDQDVLEISAEHKESEEENNARRYYMRESSNKYFRRTTLPSGVDASRIYATFRDGLLKIVMPIVAPLQPKEVIVE